VFSYEEHLWKISVQTNMYAKKYLVGVYICQSVLSVFDWMKHICVIQHPMHLNVWCIHVPISTKGFNIRFLEILYLPIIKVAFHNIVYFTFEIM